MHDEHWGGSHSRPLAGWAQELRERKAQLDARQKALERRRQELYRRQQLLERRRRRLAATMGRHPSPAHHPYFRQARRRMSGATLFGIGSLYQWILIINGLVFLLDILIGRRSLLLAGAKYGPAIWAGQYYRLLTAVFLHVDIFHLLMNGYAIYLLGPLLERSLGSLRFLVLYLMGGLAGSAASLYFQPWGISVGASGAVFGLFGYLLYTRWRSPLSLSPALSQWVTTILVLNLLITILPGTRIDMWGHFGGLAGGFLAGWVVGLPGRRNWPLLSGDPRQALGAVAAVAALAYFIWLSITPPI